MLGSPRGHRATSSSLADVEARYNKSLERIALLEEELVEKARLEEEVQRARDEWRGAFHLSVSGLAPSCLGLSPGLSCAPQT